MGLVDYSSSSSSSDTDADDCQQPPAKKQKRTSTTQPDKNITKPTTSATTPSLPPLPASFHDLYAATVRPAPGDLPSLHQGRRRAVPHVPGNWPSHIYLEWRPPPAEHQLLASLVASLSREVAHLTDPTTTTTQTTTTTTATQITSLLTSDLDAPLPLHVSLSRPFVLRTHERDAFLADLTREVQHAGAAAAAAAATTAAFTLRVDGLGWFRSPDAARSFLVLRVRSSAASNSSSSSKGRRNPELAALLARCNACVGARGQPVLYAPRRQASSLGSQGRQARGDDNDDGGGGGGGGGDDDDGVVEVDEEAFHVSIAWSFLEPTEDLRARTAAVFARDEFQRGLVGTGCDGDGHGIRIPVDGVKAKIGNVVTNIVLAGASGLGKRRGLFGI